MKENGKILFETSDVVCIATGFKSNSANSKTGGMIQTWFLWKHSSPIDAIKSGDDAAICFDCPHRGDGTGKNRACYVNIGQAPLSNEIQCPASEESGKRTTCAACQLCGGTSKNARSVAIMAHGTGKGNFSIN